MKTISKSLILVTVIAVLFPSCDKNGGGPAIEPFSQKTVEENKEIVEESAIEMAKVMDDMQNLESTDAAVNLANLLDISDPLSDGAKKKSKVSATIDVIAGMGENEYGIFEIIRVIKSAGELENEPETLQELWDELVGTYSWNPVLEDWDYVAGIDKIVFEFPSVDGGTTNDAVLTISNYTGVIIQNPLEDEYDGDLPASLNIDLKVGGVELISHVFSAEYNADGIPTKVATDLTIESFTFSVDFSNTNTKASVNHKVTHNGETVIDVGGSISGDFTQENIDNNTVTETETHTYTDFQWNEVTGQWEEVEVTYTETYEEFYAEEVIRSAEARFQVFNIALKGNVNIKALVDEIDALYPDGYYEDENYDEKETNEKEAAAYNRHLKIYAVNVAARERIAEVEAYVVEDNYYGDYYDYWVDFRLKFGDGSYVDLETYFEEGFDDFIAEVNEIIRDLNGEYNWDIEEIDY